MRLHDSSRLVSREGQPMSVCHYSFKHYSEGCTNPRPARTLCACRRLHATPPNHSSTASHSDTLPSLHNAQRSPERSLTIPPPHTKLLAETGKTGAPTDR